MNKTQPNLETISNDELISLIRDDQDNLALVYKQSQKYCLDFLRSKNFKLNDEELLDIFQDAVIVFYENVVNKPDFQLTASVKTYLSSICYNNLLKRADRKPDNVELIEEFNYQGIEDEENDILVKNESLYLALESALQAIKESGGKCYELLTFFWYQKKSMKELTDIFGYSNEQNTKNQKSKCQRRLEKLAYAQLENQNQ